MSHLHPANVLGTAILPSVLRTIVPIIYALLVRLGVVEWLALDSVFLNGAITTLVTAVIYVLIRVAERYWDKIGWLLGYPQHPVYVNGGEEVLVVEPVEDEGEGR